MTTSSQVSHKRNIYASYFISLDGVVEAPENWSFPFWNEQSAEFKQAELDRTDISLLGRKTYAGFAQAWPPRRQLDQMSLKINTMPKNVFSRTLQAADWENSHVLGADPLAEVQTLVAQGGGDIGVSGSVSVTRWLIQHGLLDELRLLVYPLTLGTGLKLFDESVPPFNLTLVEAHPFSTGVVSMVYRRAAPPVGSDRPVEVQYAEAVRRTRLSSQDG